MVNQNSWLYGAVAWGNNSSEWDTRYSDMDRVVEEHQAWLASNTPSLWAFLRKQKPPHSRPTALLAVPRPTSLPACFDDLLDSLLDQPVDSRFAIKGKLVSDERQQLALLAHMKTWAMEQSSTDPLLVLYKDWTYLPKKQVCIQLPKASETTYKFLRLPVLTLDGVEALEQCFSRDTDFRPCRVDSCLLQTELLQGKSLTSADILREQKWENDQQACLSMHTLFTSQREDIEKKALKDLYRLHREAQVPIALCQAVGCAFDRDSHNSLVSLWKVRLRNLESDLTRVFPEVNLGSNHQLSHALTRHLEQLGETETLRKWPKTSTKLLKTSVNTFKTYRSIPSLTSLLDLLITYRSLSKADSTFGSSFQTHLRSSRLHSKYKLNGCITGRLSSSDPNLQNIPRTVEFRRLFSTSPGFVLVIGDFSQVELRIAAVLARDQGMMGCYRDREDLHTLTACMILGIDRSTVTAEQRHLAKAVNFGILYGQGPRGLAKYCKANYEVTIKEDEARQYIAKFHSQFQGLASWQGQVLASSTAATPLGRVRSFTGYSDNEKLNMPIQGGAAEVMLLALVYCHRAVRKLGAIIVNIVHDELVIETPEAQAQACVQTVKAAMNQAFADYCQHLEVLENWDVADVQVGQDWSCKLSHH